MKNKTIIFFVIITLIAIIPMRTYAAYGGINTNITIGTTNAQRTSDEVTNRILGALQVLGTITAVIALMIIGIRYMISSVDGKAAMKGVMGYYITGAIIVLSTVNVVKWIYDIITSIT